MLCTWLITIEFLIQIGHNLKFWMRQFIKILAFTFVQNPWTNKREPRCAQAIMNWKETALRKKPNIAFSFTVVFYFCFNRWRRCKWKFNYVKNGNISKYFEISKYLLHFNFLSYSSVKISLPGKWVDTVLYNELYSILNLISDGGDFLFIQEKCTFLLLKYFEIQSALKACLIVYYKRCTYNSCREIFIIFLD